MNLLGVILVSISALASFNANHPAIILAQNTSDNKKSEEGRGINRVAGDDGRGNCQLRNSNNKKLIALVPEKEAVLTISNSPTFLFYVPYTSDSPLKATFRLRKKEKNNLKYNVIPPIPIELSGIPGIIRVRFQKSLETNKPYYWSLSIGCGSSKDNSKNRKVQGILKKINSNSMIGSDRQRRMTSRELAASYRKAGILLDTLALLAENRKTDPQADKEWANLLQSLNLGNIATEEVLPCCTFQK